MRIVPIENGGQTTAYAAPTIIVILVITTGAIVYLRKTRYIRKSTSVILSILTITVLVVILEWMRLHPL